MTDTTSGQPEPSGPRAFDATEWAALGIAKDEGESWWKHRIEPGDALRWRRAGVRAAIDAVRWKIAGADPSTVRQWTYAKIDAGEAVVWAELGFNVARARVHKRAGLTPVQAYGSERRAPSVSPSPPGAPGLTPHHPRREFMQTIMNRGPQQRHLVHSYMARQWFDDDAIAWALHGFDASDAIAWKELGLTPLEARRQQEQGASAMQTAKAWWKARIPVDEVADWIGAGLTPEEASQQRASGVTVEQAAVLRSLRKSEGPAG